MLRCWAKAEAEGACKALHLKSRVAQGDGAGRGGGGRRRARRRHPRRHRQQIDPRHDGPRRGLRRPHPVPAPTYHHAAVHGVGRLPPRPRARAAAALPLLFSCPALLLSSCPPTPAARRWCMQACRLTCEIGMACRQWEVAGGADGAGVWRVACGVWRVACADGGGLWWVGCAGGAGTAYTRCL